MVRLYDYVAPGDMGLLVREDDCYVCADDLHFYYVIDYVTNMAEATSAGANCEILDPT